MKKKNWGWPDTGEPKKSKLDRNYGGTGDLFLDLLGNPKKQIFRTDNIDIKDLVLLYDTVKEVSRFNQYQVIEGVRAYLLKNINNKDIYKPAISFMLKHIKAENIGLLNYIKLKKLLNEGV